MKTHPSGMTYVGTLDDNAQDSWNFPVDQTSLNHWLAAQFLDGRPLLINDGYLVLHPLGEQAIRTRHGLLWELIRTGFVRILARGADRYSLAEMPEKMAGEGIPSYAMLVTGARGDWPSLRRSLERVDEQLRDYHAFLDWPKYDSGSGFRILGQRLLDQRAVLPSLRESEDREKAFHSLLRRFVDELGESTDKPRSRWKTLVHQSADGLPPSDRAPYVRDALGLGNEMYHYNMGVMLAATHSQPIAVETRSSELFADLTREWVVQASGDLEVPHLRIPRSILTLDPGDLVSHFQPGLPLEQLRSSWLSMREESQRNPLSRQTAADAQEAARSYASEIARQFGASLEFKESEGLFGFLVGATAKPTASKIADHAGAVATSAGAVAGTAVAGPAGTVAGLAAGFLIQRAVKAGVSGITKRLKIQFLEKRLLPRTGSRATSIAFSDIRLGRVRSALDIDPAKARSLASEMTSFEQPDRP